MFGHVDPLSVVRDVAARRAAIGERQISFYVEPGGCAAPCRCSGRTLGGLTVLDRTAIVVAHRLSTAMRGDRIVIVVDDHAIVESGSHADPNAAGTMRGDVRDLAAPVVPAPE